MKQLDERGKQCPMPVIEAKQALEKAEPGEKIEVIVDNEIAVQNLTKMAKHKQLKSVSEKKGEREFSVVIEAGEMGRKAAETVQPKSAEEEPVEAETEVIACAPDGKAIGLVIVLSSNQMGSGDEVLGKLLMKGFIYALSHQEQLPEKVLMYNSGAFLSCEGSDSLEDLKELEAQGVEILTCGTCLNHYHLEDKLQVGGVTNMYDITESLLQAKRIIRP
ncbi:sulfurtransferase-like selenium metabolism protein YedF [Frisingicoccus sp.]|uniref:sulfurtransferase-like selenium metabolism protein YedF n=1 Tax=Frisingicoccus sp. TaxID=1918627 RepID=UPI003AB2B732